MLFTDVDKGTANTLIHKGFIFLPVKCRKMKSLFIKINEGW